MAKLTKNDPIEEIEMFDDDQFDDEEINFLENYKFVKRPPQRQFGGAHDVFISSSSNFIASIKRIQKMLQKDSHSAVTLHALGVAIKKAIDLANELVKQSSGTLISSVTTSTIPLVDDYEPLVDGLEPISQIRLTSAVHIKLSPQIS